MAFDVVVIGGCGHVGLPLSIFFASKGLNVGIYDISHDAVEAVNRGSMPFHEPGAGQLLVEALARGNLVASADPVMISQTENIIVVIGTPVDEHQNPDPNALPEALEDVRAYIRDGQLLVLRSTIFPGVTALTEKLVRNWGVQVEVAFAPERIAEHQAMEELGKLPQIVSATTKKGLQRARDLFGILGPDTIELSPEEAELAKLFTNVWRYVKFAVANEFFMLANSKNLDFARIREAIGRDYPRGADLPGAGFAAGPCLLKDTLQLAAFSENKFLLGNAAVQVNEGLPLYVVGRLKERYDLKAMTVGLLGMSFKAGSDDIRSSLSYKLKRALEVQAGSVLCTDPMVSKRVDGTLTSLDEVLSTADLLVICTPHSEYRSLETLKPVIDVWGINENGIAP